MCAHFFLRVAPLKISLFSSRVFTRLLTQRVCVCVSLDHTKSSEQAKNRKIEKPKSKKRKNEKLKEINEKFKIQNEKLKNQKKYKKQINKK